MANQLLGINFDFDITNIVEDSRKVKPGSIFVCIKGLHSDGHDFVEMAIKNGASFIFAEHEIDSTVDYQVVDDTKLIYSKLNAALYHHPEAKLSIIGVTGTDGKTSTSTVIKDMLSNHLAIAYMGTNGLEFKGESEYLGYTTPPADILFNKLDEVVNKGADTLCMEVSSMALDQKRCEDLHFDVSIFTNLSHEHLDVHKTMEHYFESKAILFKRMTENGLRIINIDDAYGKQLIDRHRLNTVTYGLNPEADFFATNIEYDFGFTKFDLVHNQITYNITSPLIAKYNVYNLLAAIATCHYYGFTIDEAIALIDNIKAVDGRMHVYQEDVTVVVDFAHTPNSLEKLIKYAKSITKGNVWVVFGSAGGRDQEKRPLMGDVASQFADRVVITNDDPRFEDPLKIMDEIAQACKRSNFEIIENRAAAIAYAIKNAQENDTILVTGKGNEDFQLVKGEKLDYNDINEAVKALKIRKASKEI